VVARTPAMPHYRSLAICLIVFMPLTSLLSTLNVIHEEVFVGEMGEVCANDGYE